MPIDPNLSSRKSDHIQINLEKNISSGLRTGLDDYRFVHNALPEISLKEIDLSLALFERKLLAPILISSMTGGTQEALKINRTLAVAANEAGIAMGLGSQRVGLEKPEVDYSFQVRKFAPDILLFANLGAVQLNYGYSLDHCQRAVDMIEADGLILHLNSLQEALQPEGNTNFKGLLNRIESICRALPVPVIVKEVGWGISEDVAARLAGAGVSAIDVAGAGGTSWSQVEMHRLQDPTRAAVAASFQSWGISTTESIIQTKAGAPDLPVFASGGLKNGVDIAKSIALGAALGGMAGRFLKAAVNSTEETMNVIREIREEIRICMFGIGADNLQKLREEKLIRVR